MGLFSKLKEATSLVSGNTDIPGARLGRGIITDVQLTGSSITIGAIEQYVCRITVEVALDDTERYTAVCKQKMPAWTIAQVQPGQTAVAVKVSPTDPQQVAIDWDTPATTVRAAKPTAGNSVPAKVLPEDPNSVVIDFAAALAAF